MKISVIIPTYNAEAYLPTLLEKLSTQSVAFELVIIDSSSTDATPVLAKEHADIFISIPKETFDHGGTRTIAAKKATGDIIVFLTQDALPCNNTAVETLVNTLQDITIGAVFGRQLPYEQTSLFGKHLRYFNYPAHSYSRELADKEQYGLKTAFFSDSFSAYKKAVLEDVGWFKNNLIVGEDMHIAARILLKGYKTAYCASAKVYHAHSYTITEEFKRYFDTGVFHTKEHWLLETFGKAEGEGTRYIKSELHYLLQYHAYGKLPTFFLRNLMKYLGYKLGRHYTALPTPLILVCSMHTAWWKQENKSPQHS